MFACAAFRGATYAQLLYAGDDVSAAEWYHRNWNNDASAQGRLLDLALDAVIRLWHSADERPGYGRRTRNTVLGPSRMTVSSAAR